MSKVTKDVMHAWLNYAVREAWAINDPFHEIEDALRALIEKYGDLTDDVVTATSVTMEEERKKMRKVSLAKLSNHAADIVADIANNHGDVAFTGDDVRTVEEGLKPLLSEFGITTQEDGPTDRELADHDSFFGAGDDQEEEKPE